MGVKDLWQLLSPVGRKVSIESLEGKIFAIDASIWLVQFTQAMRDENDNLIANAHLLGTIHRILKLLYNRIFPVFVFDGARPTLKRGTLQRRQIARENQGRKRQRIHELQVLQQAVAISSPPPRIVATNMISASMNVETSSHKHHHVDTTSSSSSSSSSMMTTTHTPAAHDDNDIDVINWEDGYENLIAKNNDAISNAHDSDNDNHDHDEYEYDVPETETLNAEVLSSLPYSMRKTIIEDTRKKLRTLQRRAYLHVTDNPALFSQTQINNFINTSALNQTIQRAQQHANERAINPDTLTSSSSSSSSSAQPSALAPAIRRHQQHDSNNHLYNNEVVKPRSNIRIIDEEDDSEASLMTSASIHTSYPNPIVEEATSSNPTIVNIEVDDDDDDVDVNWESDSLSSDSCQQTHMDSTEIPDDAAKDELRVITTNTISSDEPIIPVDGLSYLTKHDDGDAVHFGEDMKVSKPVHVIKDADYDRILSTAAQLTDYASRIVQKELKAYRAKPTATSLGSHQLHASSTSTSIDQLEPTPACSTSTSDAIPVSDPIVNSVDDADRSNSHHIDTTIFSNYIPSPSSRDQHRTAATSSRADTERSAEEMKHDIIELLNTFSLPYMIAPYEAEAQCAVLEQNRLVDGVITEDNDTFLFGGKMVYRHIFNDRKYVECYNIEDVDKELGLSRADLVMMSFLLGSDYDPGVRGIGIVNAMEIINAFRPQPSAALAEEKIADSSINSDIQVTYDRMLRFRSWLEDVDDVDEEDSLVLEFSKKHLNAKKQWGLDPSFPNRKVLEMFFQPQANYSTDEFSWTLPKLFKIRKYCFEKLNWTQQEIDTKIDPVTKRLSESSTQTRIDSYFMRYENDQRVSKISSGRIVAAVEEITGKSTSLKLVDKQPRARSSQSKKQHK